MSMATGAFNGMPGRQRLVQRLLSVVRPQLVIETGTFQGRTAAWLRARVHQLARVVTIEANQIEGALPPDPGVEYLRGDSGVLVPRVIQGLQGKPRVFAYLDAHGRGPLPLRKEVEAITADIRDGVILIDDFAVPHDPGYTYMIQLVEGEPVPDWLQDAREKNAALGLGDYNGPTLDIALVCQYGLSGWRALWPTVASSDEPPPRTGCVVLASPSLFTLLRQQPELRA